MVTASLQSLKEKLPANLRRTLTLRAFGLLKVPMILFVSPSVVEMNDERSVIKIPLNRRTRNHLGSMYFGSLAVGADCAGGLLAMHLIEQSGKNLSLIFKDFKAEFLKRPEGDVYFTCPDSAAVRELIQKALETKARENLPLNIVATVPSISGDEPVAKFVLTLSVKLKQ